MRTALIFAAAAAAYLLLGVYVQEQDLLARFAARRSPLRAQAAPAMFFVPNATFEVRRVRSSP
jgi:hypothetical protein